MKRLIVLMILLCAAAATAVPPAPPPPTPTLALTRPDPFELQSKPFRVAEPVRARIECTAIRMKFGGGSHTGAWLVDTDSGREIWRSDPAHGQMIGKSRILYSQKSEVDLPPGNYALYQFGGGRWVVKNPFSDLGTLLNDLADLINKESPQKEPDKYYGKCMVTMVSDDGRSVFGPVYGRLCEDCLIDLRRVEDNDLRMQSFRVKKRLTLQLTSVGEGSGSDTRFFDFGWIEHAGTGVSVWRMEMPYCLNAGGAEKNIICTRPLTLDPGLYTAGYVTDSSHAYDAWNAMPPTMPEWWGLCLDADPRTASDVELLEPDEISVPGLLVSFLRVGDDEKRKAVFELSEESDLQIYAIGEGRSDRMYDYGWIVDLDSGDEVWSMEGAECRHAGGTKRNVLFDGTITLPPGRYQAIYVTDDSHAFGKWNSPSPDQSTRYGMVIRRR